MWELRCGSQPTAPTCVVWSWHLKHSPRQESVFCTRVFPRLAARNYTRLGLHSPHFEEDDRSSRLLSRPMVRSSLSKSRLFFRTKTSLMVPGLLTLPYLAYYPAFWWWTGICVVCGIVVNPLFAIFVPFRATDRLTALTRTSAESVGKAPFCSELYLWRVSGRLCGFSAPGVVFAVCGGQCKDNELDLLKSQSILQDLVPVSGDSSGTESNQRPSKRVEKDKGSSAKRSNSAPSPTFNICFTDSQEFNSLVANSAELDGITSKGNNESNAVRNISNERLNVINDNTSANRRSKWQKLFSLEMKTEG